MGGSLCRNAPLRRMVEKTAKELGIRVFVETGTHLGRTAEWAARIFDDVLTIELDEAKYESISERVWANPPLFGTIHPYWGDAGEVLPHLLANAVIREPAVFWLDAHNFTDRPPIRETLAAVLAQSDDHVIYIDDAQFYWLQAFPGWPTMDELREMLDGRALALVADSMIAYPPKWGRFLRKIAKAEKRSTLIPGIPT